MDAIHIPVLLHEVIRFLDPKDGDFIVDGTLDGGGYAETIISSISEGTFLGVDWDREMLSRTEARLSDNGPKSVSTIFVNDNFANLSDVLSKTRLGKIDGLVLDLGFSSEQLELSGRGFSFLRDEPLLMTYSDEAEPVYEILRRLSESELADIIYNLSGERYSRRIAKAIKTALKSKSLVTSGELASVVSGALPKGYEKGRINPATRTFQALRIYANHELENLDKVLSKLPEIMAPDGKVVIVSFHSLEDVRIKKAFKNLSDDGLVEILTKKPITAHADEIRMNPRARSAKLRAIKFNSV
ncbi:MAG: 16S rRNA (cytosine(1402)-N(4))-methyltransferase [Candidatus Harrisonbacteria bacterium CG10_big_fil_rev_8_21_14_0_10_40_38]|uniref:Ribosomal RNA small subunit methyltransferase H n=1 Tax=Candidatus Harrisonbacteria bacterium CG10_big_fil_rev_8_21_14_0_10_40_38 TaxID=1974583 RepID=A0A2H0USZ5_9BACT|nr:MAG: 16S rRNA (cytosine(1402)-N(4))-methyltransferase [Candidatus Harrisonbacteria bacterium CG10_big_fil_rev_8_21_14_0_10_40_38]